MIFQLVLFVDIKLVSIFCFYKNTVLQLKNLSAYIIFHKCKKSNCVKDYGHLNIL